MALVQASDFFAIPDSLTAFRPFFPSDVPPWEWLPQIARALAAAPGWEGEGSNFKFHPAAGASPGIRTEGWIHLDPTVRLPAYATILGPCWIGPGCDIRPGAFIRGGVIAGAGCVLGNASEFKNCLLMDGVEAPHYNYVGDSILGNRAHLGAGAICSNLRLDRRPVTVRIASGETVDTGLRKFGAVLGDHAEVGCNAVLNPGALLGRRSMVAPCLSFAGWLPPATIARARVTVAQVPRPD